MPSFCPAFPLHVRAPKSPPRPSGLPCLPHQAAVCVEEDEQQGTHASDHGEGLQEKKTEEESAPSSAHIPSHG